MAALGLQQPPHVGKVQAAPQEPLLAERQPQEEAAAGGMVAVLAQLLLSGTVWCAPPLSLQEAGEGEEELVAQGSPKGRRAGLTQRPHGLTRSARARQAAAAVE
eukprot:CAMPEP_0202400516 /NCGR_PEP_ID=MMETSP1128-20130828/2795_1 /ASSEMBLY_ACC=CAM_ASM_000463 /TAXON_ID=3047 /ORGANISM="Dunaliella tertiolecta, Strain CCMP1320" /LENGTH=103 /DNA_ID=CAMNT_0049004089 /DNA_START=760 /DNA_END=1068 /DNA_ORIENTATION=+